MRNILLLTAVAALVAWMSNDAMAQKPRGEKGGFERGGQAEKGPGGEQRRGKRGGPEGQAGPGRRGGPEMIEKLFERMDQNGDGFIAADEVPEKMKERLAKIDTNGDNQIEKSELLAAMKSRMGQGRRGPGNPGEGGERNPGQMFDKLDADGSGTISKEEAPERMAQNFDRIDSNGDGEIDKTEMQALVERMRQGGGKGDGAGKGRRGEGPDKAGQKPKRPEFE